MDMQRQYCLLLGGNDKKTRAAQRLRLEALPSERNKTSGLDRGGGRPINAHPSVGIGIHCQCIPNHVRSGAFNFDAYCYNCWKLVFNCGEGAANFLNVPPLQLVVLDTQKMGTVVQNNA